MPLRISEGPYFNGNKTIGGTLTVGGQVLAQTTLAIGATDTVLSRDTANTLGLRNGVNGQIFSVYNTYTDASNYERLALWASGTDVIVDLQKAGTGTNRDLYVRNNTVGNLFLTTNGKTWRISTTGDLQQQGAYDFVGRAGTTTMTAGFMYIPTAAGAPTGVPVNKSNTFSPLYYDTTNSKLWVYDNVAGAWKGIVVV